MSVNGFFSREAARPRPGLPNRVREIKVGLEPFINRDVGAGGWGGGEKRKRRRKATAYLARARDHPALHTARVF